MPNRCTYGGVYASLMFCKGKTVLPGLRNRLYFIPKAWIVSWPTLRPVAGDMVSTFSIYDGSFTSTRVAGNGVFAQMLLDAGIPVLTEEEWTRGERLPGAEE